MPKPIDLSTLRRYAVARALFAPTTLARAIDNLGFVQADPIRAPAPAQDLTLRHRVKNYRAGDLKRRFTRLAIEEDFFINHGILPRDTQRLMHPRQARSSRSANSAVRSTATPECCGCSRSFGSIWSVGSQTTLVRISPAGGRALARWQDPVGANRVHGGRPSDDIPFRQLPGSVAAVRPRISRLSRRSSDVRGFFHANTQR